MLGQHSIVDSFMSSVFLILIASLKDLVATQFLRCHGKSSAMRIIGSIIEDFRVCS